MAIHFLKTGEAFLSAADKRYARVPFIRQHIERDPGIRLVPGLAVAALAVAVAGLTLAAFSI